MEKEFLTYNLSLRMKQLGFDEPCFVWADIYTKQNVYMYPTNKNNMNQYSETVSIPTLQSAFRWFREKHNLLTYIGSRTLDNGDTIYIPNGRTIPDTVKNGFVVDNIIYEPKKTYEEAELACLEKLIEIVENEHANR